MNVLFLIPPSPGNRRIIRLIECSHESKASYLWQPFDYMIISARLAPTDTACLIDGTAERLSQGEFYARLEKTSPDLMFLSLSSVCWDWDYGYFKEIRRRFPTTPLYLVGDIFLEDAYLQHVLAECEGVVFIPHLIDLKAMSDSPRRGNVDLPGLRKPGGGEGVSKKVVSCPVGVPRHEVFQKPSYGFPFSRHFRFATVSMVWGCPFSCSYCNMRSVPPVARPNGEILEELRLVASMGIRELFFADKAFGFLTAQTLELLIQLERDFKFSWSCYFHPQVYRPELLDAMRAAGCHTLIIGIESANLKGLAAYQRNVDEDRLVKLLGHCRRIGMEVCADFIIGLEHETEADIRRTIDYALSLPIDYASFNIAAPLPGSGIRERMTATGEMVFGLEGFDTLAKAGVRPTGGLPEGKIYELRRRAVRRFYFNPRRLLRRLFSISSFEHLIIQLRQLGAMLGKS